MCVDALGHASIIAFGESRRHSLTSPVRRALIVFARAPEAGVVKTRLAAELGDAEALRLYREMGTAVVAQATRGAWQCTVAFTPHDGAPTVRAWLGDALDYVPQVAGDLGERMGQAIRSALSHGADRVVVIGTDCPELESGDIVSAFDALDEADVVFGPATDGGYYLIGVRGDHPALFERMAWSAPDTLAVSLDRAAQAGLVVRLLGLRSDIDTAEDLRAWRARRSRAADA